MSKSAMGIAVTTVSTTQQMPLGFIHVEPAQSVGSDAGAGERTWIYVQMTGGAIAQGEGVMRAAGATTYVVVQSAAVNPARVVGVAQHAIPQDSYGFVQRAGQAECLADGSVTADTAIVPALAGQFTDAAAATDAAVGISSETDAGATLVTAVISCHG